jgi:hypothetical protein
VVHKKSLAITTVIRSANGTVMVFDRRGEQLPKYAGCYSEVREKILKDAPPEARFGYFPDDELELRMVPRKEW